MGLARYMPDGKLDASFGGDGKVTTNFAAERGGKAEADAVALQDDGRIVMAGQSEGENVSKFAVARYKPNGHLDTSFGGDGRVTTAFGSPQHWEGADGVVIQSDGKIVAAGWSEARFVLARYRSNGRLDTTFGGGDGKVITRFGRAGAFASDLALQPDGKIVAVGFGRNRFALARYKPGGRLDPTFGGDGKVTSRFGSRRGGDIAEGVAIQPDGSIVAAGDADDLTTFALARYESNGQLDPNFGGGDGKVTTRFKAGDFVEGADDVAIQTDGRIVLAGLAAWRFALARYSPAGDLDPTFGGDGKVLTNINKSFEEAFSVGLQSDGRIVAAGEAGASGAVVRYLAA
jgi:uncharacterized delta-60 repeat protein